MEIKKIDNASLCREISANILNGLPKWFGISESTNEYIKESSNMPFWVAYDKNEVIGFIALKKNSEFASEIYVMGIE